MTQQSTTKERANFRILLLVFVPVCGMGTIAQAKAVSRTATRYLYILNCDAILPCKALQPDPHAWRSGKQRC